MFGISKSSTEHGGGQKAEPERPPFNSGFQGSEEKPKHSSSSTYQWTQTRTKSSTLLSNKFGLIVAGLMISVSVVCGIWIWRSLHAEVRRHLAKIDVAPRAQLPFETENLSPTQSYGPSARQPNTSNISKGGRSQSPPNVERPLMPVDATRAPPKASDSTGSLRPSDTSAVDRNPNWDSSESSKSEQPIQAADPIKISGESEATSVTAPMKLDAANSVSESILAQKSRAEKLGIEIETSNDLGMKLILIPPGDFMMGSPEDRYRLKNRETLHGVRISHAFLIGRYEVTKGQFAKFVEQTEYMTESQRNGKGGDGYDQGKIVESNRKFTWRNTGFPQRDDEPVVNVSWSDSIAFCNWLSKNENLPEFYTIIDSTVQQKGGPGYRLPTEAEWEYACRAGSDQGYSFVGSKDALVRFGNAALHGFNSTFPDDHFEYTSPVGSFLPNAFGLFDMHGNVNEWCWDRCDKDIADYVPVFEINPTGSGTGDYRIVRGGSFWDTPLGCQSSLRGRFLRSNTTFVTGIRVVRYQRIVEGLKCDYRDFTDASGTHTKWARMIRLVGDNVFLNENSGKEIMLPISKLSAEDQNYIVEILASLSKRFD